VVEEDLRWRRFIDLRFRAFVFVSETEVAERLGPGSHPAELRERTREALKAEAAEKELSVWLLEARGRAGIRYASAADRPLPLPFPMPPPAGPTGEVP
jgi:hypothetical protein